MGSRRATAAEDAVIADMIGTCVLMRSRLIARVITGLHDEALRPFGVGSAQLVLLLVISHLQPASRAEIARFHHQDRSTLTRNLRIILEAGWAEELMGGGKGRAKPVVLTEPGRDLLLAAAPAWRLAQARAKALLGQRGVSAVMEIASGIMSGRPPG